MQSQSSSNLPSAQQTSNMSKNMDKNGQNIKQQLGSPNIQNYNSAHNLKPSSQKMKMNYDDLKKFLLKEYSASQANYILQ
jgi:hypothetical protein